MRYLKSILNHFEKVLITLSMIIMVVLIFIQVFTRYVMGDAMTGMEEAARYLFIWLIFLSIGIGFSDKAHISIDIIIDRLPIAAQKALRQFVYIVLFGIFIYFTYQGYLLVENMMGFGQNSATLQIPMWLVYLSLPVGFLFASLRLIQTSINLWKEDDNQIEKEGPIL
ncbi:TRAP transporter small permease [Oceanobacillus damuensis]|uniref:TRAP transporter small permease n=1 Tax=Oceanobacillus damuensis TaxID=937928 RepID=UPI000832304C|nr:TRAP transporter small permease [Oceanobacillus damuensis]